jgi:hypothetical protein
MTVIVPQPGSDLNPYGPELQKHAVHNSGE